MRKLFDKEVNWDNIGSVRKGPLKMTNVFQKCRIEVDTFPSKCLKILLSYFTTQYLTDPSNRFLAGTFSDFRIPGNETTQINITHPFMFLIVDENHHNILLMGKVTEPAAFNIDDYEIFWGRP